jgi:pimeloyl-ACP methyl ester carboxylesterase
MPLLVQGNTRSGVVILFLHGGPGASGFYDKFGKFFSGIEREYAVAYWEQRGGGISQGNAAPVTMTVEQIFSDIDAVITLLRHTQNNPTIILMGHSWGGGLGTAYLASRSTQGFHGIKAWIDVDGDHDDALSDSLSEQFVLRFAHQQIAQKRDETYWNEALAYYGRTHFSELGRKHTEYVQAAGGYFHGKEHIYASTDNIFFSASTGFDFLSNNSYSRKHLDNEQLMPYTRQMQRITVPSLILFGRHDGIVPVEMAEDAWKRLGTPQERKRIVIFEKSAHSPYIEEKEAFTEAVVGFVREL